MRHIDKKEIDQIIKDTYSPEIFEMCHSGGGLTTAWLYRTLTLNQVEEMRARTRVPVAFKNGIQFNDTLNMLTRVYGGENLLHNQLSRVERFLDEQYQDKRVYIDGFTEQVISFYEKHKKQITESTTKSIMAENKTLKGTSNDPLKEEIVRIFNKKLDLFKKDASLEKFDLFFNGADVRPFSTFIARNLD